MPDVSDSIQQLKAKFLQKGLSEKDLVLLSGKLPLSLSLSLSCMFDDLMVAVGTQLIYHDLVILVCTYVTN